MCDSKQNIDFHIYTAPDVCISAHNFPIPSPLLSALFGVSNPPSHLLLPDLPVTVLQLLLSSLSGPELTKDQIQSLIPTLTTLGAFLSSSSSSPAPEAASTSPSIACFPLRSSQPYFKDIPALPDIQSTELFDPEYLEDVEIENEENLSLTIIDSAQTRLGGDGSTTAIKRKQRRKGVPRPRRARGSDGEKEAKEGKNLEARRNELPCGACDHTASTENELLGHTRCFLAIISFLSNLYFSCLRLEHSTGQRAQHICACGKTFKKHFQLANHQRCLSQNFKFSQPFNSRVHSGDRPFVCHTCGKAFNQEVTLRTHMRIHSGARPYKCDHCGEAFNASSALVAHRQWKHTDGSRPFLCSFCSKSFPTKAAVKKHETIHKPVAEKRHPCAHCDKRFARADHLKSHMRAHKPNVPVLLGES